MPQQLGDRAAHRVADGGQLRDVQDVGQRGDVVGTISEPEMACADAVPVAAMVNGDHAVPRRQRLEAPQPVETAGRRQAVQQHDGGRTWGTGCFAYERRAAARELDEPSRGYEGRRRHQRGLTHWTHPSKPTISTLSTLAAGVS